ncbi:MULTISPECIES: Gfo/Idh/MocA family protein [Streptomyces]|uniref:Gfo/Idh/MocA family protein n=1 Tax=Streptomyces TaxID=1883 RepID=UPI0009969C22|nr:Gfo/Idh/MocA family oxidoreductase [Streptomyces exfoliatus]
MGFRQLVEEPGPVGARQGKPGLRGALIGYGTIAEGHLTGISRTDGLEITAVVDVSPARRAAARRELPGVRVLAELDELPVEELDFIDVCTPPHVHLDGIRFGLRHDLAVLCEKPLLLDRRELEALEPEEKASRGFLFPCHNYRFAPSVIAMKAALDGCGAADGDFRGHFRTLRTSHARGTADWRPDWRRERSVGGGGILRDHGPHSVYLAAHLVGSRPDRVRCDLRRPEGGPYADTEEYAFLSLSFASGAVVDFELDWTAAGRQTSYLVSGSWGHVRLIDDDLESCVDGTARRSRLPSDFNDPRHGNWFKGVFEEFLAEVSEGGRSARLREDAAVTIRVIEAAYRSAALGGRWIDV